MKEDSGAAWIAMAIFALAAAVFFTAEGKPETPRIEACAGVGRYAFSRSGDSAPFVVDTCSGYVWVLRLEGKEVAFHPLPYDQRTSRSFLDFLPGMPGLNLSGNDTPAAPIVEPPPTSSEPPADIPERVPKW